MPMWEKDYSPEHFVLAFHQAVCSGAGMFYIGESETESDARRLGLRFGVFKAACRRYPAHPSSRMIDDIHTKLVHKDWESLPGDKYPWKTYVKVTYRDNFGKKIRDKLWDSLK